MKCSSFAGILIAVIIGVILGAIIGSILLGFVYMCFKRYVDGIFVVTVIISVVV